MLTTKLKFILYACGFLLVTSVAANDEQGLSEEFLNFLIEFENADENTFDMLVENGKEDVLKSRQGSSESNKKSNLRNNVQEEVTL